MRKYLAILGLLALLVPLVLGGISQPNASAQEPEAQNKISSLLTAQVAAKARAVKAGGVQPALEASLRESRFDILQTPGIRLENLNKQRLFIHFAQEPSQSQVAELEAMGITPYLDSWIPPVGDHPTGFIIADMPVDKLETLAGKNFITRLDTAERLLKPQNDLAIQQINADDVWLLGYDGTGIKIAVLDSGLDINHGDLPTSFTSKDYSNWPTLDDTIANTFTGHGTHVTGSALGRGAQSSGVYKGSAPDADLIFLKIGLDGSGSATTDAMVNATKDARDFYNADVITMSYGGWSTHHDGTSQTSQAVDYAVSQGAVVFISAGNEANDAQHYSGTVPASDSTPFIQVNVTGAVGNDTTLWFNLVWYDGLGTNNVLSGQFYDSTPNPIVTYNDTQSESSRGTEAREFYIGTSSTHSAAGNGTYWVEVTNASGASQDFHLYVWIAGGGSVTFASPDRDYTISSPAEADSAIAVGAYVTKDEFTDYKGVYHTLAETVDTIASFSSRGPRVDTGAPSKPNIVAPGSVLVSARDDDVYPLGPPPRSYDWLIVDNDGLNLDGSGPAEYYVMQGTSMASPIAAGVAALILDKNPGWTPAQVQYVLEFTATDKGTAGVDDIYGWGLIDALAALPTLESYKEGYPPSGTQDDLFLDFATENVVYMYATGLKPNYSYRIAFYDGGTTNDNVETQTWDSDGSGNLSRQHTFTDGVDEPGTWNVIVCDAAQDPPSTYDPNWTYILTEDTFEVETSAIPEFPTALAAMVALALSAGIYLWMRRKVAPAPA